LSPTRLPALHTGDCAPEQDDTAAPKELAKSPDSPQLAVLPMLVDTALWAKAQREIRNNSSHWTGYYDMMSLIEKHEETPMRDSTAAQIAAALQVQRLPVARRGGWCPFGGAVAR
jgi:hypothetical protein